MDCDLDRALRSPLAGATFGACYCSAEAAGSSLLVAHALVAAKLSAHVLAKARAKRRLTLRGLSRRRSLLITSGANRRWTISGKLAGHLWQGSRRAGDLVPDAATLMPNAATAFAQLLKALRHEYEIFNLIFPVGFVLLAGLGLFRRRWTRERARREFYLFSFVGGGLGYRSRAENRVFVQLVPA